MEEIQVEEKLLKSAGAELLPEGRNGLRIHGWEIESRNRSILKSSDVRQWEQKLNTSHLPEMVFGESGLTLKHLHTGVIIHFNAMDALAGWKQEALPPVEVPAAAKWKFRSKPLKQVILDYDYTFTTPYCGSETMKITSEGVRETSDGSCSLQWEDCKEQIDVVALASKEPILFYDEIILYEDELADNGVSLLTVKVRVMPSSWFLLLRFWLRVDGVLMRIRDTRVHCIFGDSMNPIVIRERCWREATFKDLSAKGLPNSAVYSDPSIVSQKLPIVLLHNQKLKFPECGRACNDLKIGLFTEKPDIDIILWVWVVICFLEMDPKKIKKIKYRYEKTGMREQRRKRRDVVKKKAPSLAPTYNGKY